MGGVDVAGVTALADIAKECGVTLTIAGGITTEKDIVTLDRLGCEAQVKISNVSIESRHALTAPFRLEWLYTRERFHWDALCVRLFTPTDPMGYCDILSFDNFDIFLPALSHCRL